MHITCPQECRRDTSTSCSKQLLMLRLSICCGNFCPGFALHWALTIQAGVLIVATGHSVNRLANRCCNGAVCTRDACITTLSSLPTNSQACHQYPEQGLMCNTGSCTLNVDRHMQQTVELGPSVPQTCSLTQRVTSVGVCICEHVRMPLRQTCAHVYNTHELQQ